MEPQSSYAGDLTCEEALTMATENSAALFIDVRTAAEWTYVGQPDLSGIGREVIGVEWVRFPGGVKNESFVDDLRAAGATEDTPLIFLCRSGARSVAAAEAATAAGLGPAYNILEGFEGPQNEDGHRGSVAGWKASGLAWKQG